MTLFVMNWPEEGPLQLPPVDQRITATRTRSGGKAEIKQTDTEITVSLEQSDRNHVATVIELTFDGDPFDIEPVSVIHKSHSVAFGKSAKASNVFRGQSEYAPGKAPDDDPQTRRATDSGTLEAWLEVDLGQPTPIGQVMIDEAYEGRIRQFALEYRMDGEWATALSGTTVGRRYSRRFEPITARHVRLNILKATEGPTIWEFQLMVQPK